MAIRRFLSPGGRKSFPFEGSQALRVTSTTTIRFSLLWDFFGASNFTGSPAACNLVSELLWLSL